MKALLWAIEDVSNIFGLKLNKGKCQQISCKPSRNIMFKDGTTVPQVNTAEYLGSLLHDEANPRPEIIKRINLAAYGRKKLSDFWSKNKILNKRDRIKMHEALIASKLLYALEATPIPKAMYDRIDASYYKGLRQIMGFKTTFAQQQEGTEKTNTNEALIESINKELKKAKKGKEFIKISTRIKDRAIKLLGKTIRRNDDDPMKEVIMQGESWNIPEKGGNRVGRPNTNWLIETANQAWKKHEIYKHNRERIKRMGIINRNKRRDTSQEDKKEKMLKRKRTKKKKSKAREARSILKESMEGLILLEPKERKNLIIEAFSKKEREIFDKVSGKRKKKEQASLQARKRLKQMINDEISLSEEIRIETIDKAFTNKERASRPASDMMDSTIAQLLKKYENKENNEQHHPAEDAHTPQQKEEEFRNKLTSLLSEYEEVDNACPDTETESQVNTDDLSGSDKEEIDYRAPNAVNREDLPETSFNYKNKDHVERLLEAAKSMVF